MSAAPRPPFLPGSLEEFTDHAATHHSEWFQYCRLAYEYIEEAEAAIAEARGQADQTSLKLQASEMEVSRLKEELSALHLKQEKTQARNQGIIEYQKEQLQESQQKYLEALKEKDEALRLATPVVNTPARTPEPTAEIHTVAPVGTPASVDPPSTSSARLSERLPDPDRFEGDRKDLRRFISQIHEKMNVNHDRYPTPQSRMTYVTNRLRGAPYAQVLPYIKKGICQLKDYEEILKILDRAFGDPNRVNNARNELFRLRQANKEFGMFFAEFQRLALEGEMSEDVLPTLLEQAINRELRGMLMHNEPPNREYHQFANFLQDLENRRRHYENNSPPAARTYASATKPTNPVRPTELPATLQPAENNTDVMDLSSAHRHTTSRRDRGECFRCGSKNHLVRNCPLPDNRPPRTYTCVGTIPFPISRPVSKRSESGLSRDQTMNERTIRISAAATQGLTVEEESYRSNLMILPITLSRHEKELLSYAMLDTGAEGKRFIDKEWAQDQGLELLPLKKPIRLETFDGQEAESGPITHYAQMHMRINDHQERRACFLVTQLAHYPVVLGLPWLKIHDPRIGFAEHPVLFDSSTARNTATCP
ncbi:hypothetical protein SI65_02532 [Aspergillus cristatus]|uniref:CCHC-type domain-containing protein n=1 Tax=Aspergillus cristatus TaxID=573508 RepID=A0A1E3BL98_ASPCR|nr:hypothetical protein SI65_02532 [Aspergillus cristatus]